MHDNLEKYFDQSFDRFIEAERANILRGTSERNLCGRLALQLENNKQNFGLENYFSDIEYNRNRGRIKTIIDSTNEVVSITCDIIVHRRGHTIKNDNLIAIEMKRSTHSKAEKQKDQIRLRALTKTSYDDVWSADGKTLPEHVCGYALGYFLELDAEKPAFNIEQYAEGILVAEWQCPI